MNITISPLEAREVGRCAELLATSDPWKKLKFDASWLREFIKREEVETYAGTVDGKLVGLISVIEGGFLAQPYIPLLFVCEEWRNKGVGAQLVHYVEERYLPNKSCIFVLVSDFNERAKKFYVSGGFAEVGRLNDYFEKGHDEIIMRKLRE